MSDWITYFKVSSRINTNSLFYYLRKLPFVSSLITLSIFSRGKLKDYLGFLGFIYNYLKKFIAKVCFFSICIEWIPSIFRNHKLIQGDVSLNYKIFIFLIIFCLLPAITNPNQFRVENIDYVLLNHFTLNPERYYKMKAIILSLKNIILFVPIYIYFFKDTAVILFLLVMKECATVSGNALYLWMYKHYHKILHKNIRTIIICLIFIATYISNYLNLLPQITFTEGLIYLLMLIALSVSTICWSYLLRFRGYKEIANKYASKDIMKIYVGISNGLTEGETGLKSMKSEEGLSYHNDHKAEDPVEYMHRAFQNRYKKAINRLYRQNIFINIFLLSGLGLLIKLNIVDIHRDNILIYSGILLTVISNMLVSKQYTTMCFRHVDLPLFYHKLYTLKDKQKLMKLRYSFVIKIACISLASFYLGITLLIKIADLPIGLGAFTKLAAIYALILFIYETFDFLIYYVIQPYSVDLVTKNPCYTISGMLLLSFCGYFLFANSDISWLLLPLFILFIILVSLLVISSFFIEKTFKLRY